MSKRLSAEQIAETRTEEILYELTDALGYDDSDKQAAAYHKAIDAFNELHAAAARREQRMREALHPFVVSEKTAQALKAIARDDGKPRLQGQVADLLITDHDLLQARRAALEEK